MRWNVVDEVTAFNGGLRPFTAYLGQDLQNDLTNNFTTVTNTLNGLHDRVAARYPGLPRNRVGLFPQKSSSDNFLTRVNQTSSAGVNDYPAGTKYQIQVTMAAGQSGRVAGYVPTDSVWMDATYPGTWPAAPWLTTLTAQAGTDGVTQYNTIQVADEPMVGDVIRWGTGGAQSAVILSYTGTGPYDVQLATSTVTVVASGTVAYVPYSSDGLHGTARGIKIAADTIPQSYKGALQG
jgi:hypothetical protein